LAGGEVTLYRVNLQRNNKSSGGGGRKGWPAVVGLESPEVEEILLLTKKKQMIPEKERTRWEGEA